MWMIKMIKMTRTIKIMNLREDSTNHVKDNLLMHFVFVTVVSFGYSLKQHRKPIAAVHFRWASGQNFFCHRIHGTDGEFTHIYP